MNRAMEKKETVQNNGIAAKKSLNQPRGHGKLTTFSPVAISIAIAISYFLNQLKK